MLGGVDELTLVTIVIVFIYNENNKVTVKQTSVLRYNISSVMAFLA